MTIDLVARARQGKLDPVYIIGSDQPLLIDRTVSVILDAAVPPEMRAFNHEVIEPKNATASRILAACQTLPMMAERRSVLVRDLAAMPAEQLNKLMPYIDAPNPTTVLVALTSKLDKRLKFYMHALKRKVRHELSAPTKIIPWIEDEAERQHVNLGRGAAERLGDVVGKDLARLVLAMEQLALFVGDRPIEVDDIDDLIADTRERSVFELINAISAGNRAQALRAVAALCDQQDSSIGVVVMLARHMRSLGMCHAAREQRITRDGDLARLVGGQPWKVKKLMAESSCYTRPAIGRALAKISAADCELKGQTSVVKVLGRELGERVILERLVSDIIGLRATHAPGGRQRQRSR